MSACSTITTLPAPSACAWAKAWSSQSRSACVRWAISSVCACVRASPNQLSASLLEPPGMFNVTNSVCDCSQMTFST